MRHKNVIATLILINADKPTLFTTECVEKQMVMLFGKKNEYLNIPEVKFRHHARNKARSFFKRWNKHGKKIAPLDVCVICGSTINLEYHHPDYSQPLFVLVMCRECHSKLRVSDEVMMKWIIAHNDRA